VTDGLGDGRRLGVIRIQEADQDVEGAATRIVRFLAAAPGRIVDAAASSDEVREIVVVGYAPEDRRSSSAETPP
jgi:hypothetical protein